MLGQIQQNDLRSLPSLKKFTCSYGNTLQFARPISIILTTFLPTELNDWLVLSKLDSTKVTSFASTILKQYRFRNCKCHLMSIINICEQIVQMRSITLQIDVYFYVAVLSQFYIHKKIRSWETSKTYSVTYSSLKLMGVWCLSDDQRSSKVKAKNIEFLFYEIYFV